MRILHSWKSVENFSKKEDAEILYYDTKRNLTL